MGNATISTPRAAWAYVRISEDRTGEGLGVERLLERCRDLAARKGWPLIREIVENDTSATTGRRPKYEDELLTGMRDGSCGAVIVVDQDRLVRKPAELEHFIELADRHGVLLADVTGELNLSTPDGRLVARLKGSVAAHEGEIRIERIRRQRDQAATRGIPQGGPRPFGYLDDHITTDPVEAEAVRDAARRVLAGESLRSIASRWNTQGLKTARGGEWSTNSVRVVLTGPRVAGLRQHRGEIVGEAAWPAIIARDEREQIVALCKRRKGHGGRPPRLLTRIATCGKCGRGLLTGYRTRPKQRIYVCKQSPGEHLGCGGCAILAEPLEDEVRDQVIVALAGPALHAALERRGRRDEQGRRLAHEITLVGQRIEELSHARWAEGAVPHGEYLRRRGELDERLRAARAALEQTEDRGLLATLPSDQAALRSKWDRRTEPVAWRRQVVEAIVEKVVIGEAGGRPAWDPERVTIVWRA